MDVADAVARRASTRQFLPTPVADETLRDLLVTASRAPSGGNLQPWRVYVVNGAAMTRLLDLLAARPDHSAEYDIYPANLWEPYRTNRYALGEALYATIGIGRDDRDGRFAQFARNAEFFGAPAAIFCCIDRNMGPPQWSDLGMFLQTFMLLATEAGLATCPQEYWASRHAAIEEFCSVPTEEMLFCGVAVGHADPTAAINTLHSQRMPLHDWASFVE